MVDAFGFEVGGSGFLCGIIEAEMPIFAICHNPGPVFLGVVIPGIALASLVMVVFLVCHDAKVQSSIIACVMVDVIPLSLITSLQSQNPSVHSFGRLLTIW